MPKFIYVPVPRDTRDGFLANAREGWKDFTSRYLNERLADVGDDDKLYIVGHGSLAGTSLQTLSATALMQFLIKEKLPATHRRFNLFSCYSGVKMPGAGRSFAEEFTYAIRDHFKSATVIGYVGAVQFSRSSNQLVVSSLSSFSDSGDDMGGVVGAGGAKVSFSVQRKWIGSNNVVANQANSFVAKTQQEEEEVVSPFGDGTISRLRVVVLGSDAAEGRGRSGAIG